jgi:hypothetical protein
MDLIINSLNEMKGNLIASYEQINEQFVEVTVSYQKTILINFKPKGKIQLVSNLFYQGQQNFEATLEKEKQALNMLIDMVIENRIPFSLCRAA